MPIMIHINKSENKDGKWELTVLTEQTNESGECSTALSQTTTMFDTEPQIQYLDFT